MSDISSQQKLFKLVEEGNTGNLASTCHVHKQKDLEKKLESIQKKWLTILWYCKAIKQGLGYGWDALDLDFGGKRGNHTLILWLNDRI